MSEQAVPPPADFGAQVAAAQRQLSESIARAGLSRDPYRHVLEAHVVALAVLPAFVEQIEAGHQPWTEDERRAAALDFVARLDGRIAQRMVQFNRWALIVGIVACTALLTGTGWVAYRQGYGERVSEVQRAVDGLAAAASTYGGPEAAAHWFDLMRLNDVARAKRDCWPVAGREACQFVFWTLPPPAQAQGDAAHQQQVPAPMQPAGQTPQAAARAKPRETR